MYLSFLYTLLPADPTWTMATQTAAGTGPLPVVICSVLVLVLVVCGRPICSGNGHLPVTEVGLPMSWSLLILLPVTFK